jgi:hypothetical protein
MQDLPTRDELELAMFGLAHFGSELDSFKSDVLLNVDEGHIQPSDHDAAVHILAFAVAARESIASSLKDLDELEAQALSIYHESVDGKAYWQRVTTATIDEMGELQRA